MKRIRWGVDRLDPPALIFQLHGLCNGRGLGNKGGATQAAYGRQVISENEFLSRASKTDGGMLDAPSSKARQSLRKLCLPQEQNLELASQKSQAT